MKKFEWKSVLALALTGVLALGLTACGSSDSKTADAGSAAAADGKATKIIIPSEIQGLAGLAAGLKGVLSDSPVTATAPAPAPAGKTAPAAEAPAENQ